MRECAARSRAKAMLVRSFALTCTRSRAARGPGHAVRARVVTQLGSDMLSVDSWTALRGPVLVVGAGFIGMRVAASLRQHGAPVTVVHRSPLAPGPAHEIAGSRLLQGSAADERVVHSALEGVRHVIWCAGGG